MNMSRKTLYILDGNALLHRAWHAIPPLATQEGLIVNAVYGFTNVMEKIRHDFKPDYLCVAWDLPGKTFRHDAVESYKATRAKKEPELYAQIPLIQELLLSYHVPSYSVPGYEADDVIGTVAEIVKKQNVDVVIVTGDMDALQLVDDHVSVLSFVKGVTETKLYNEQAVVDRIGLKPEQLIDYKALRGDTSDNIKGIAGIGEKGALELIQKYQTVDGIFEALKNGEVASKFAKKLEGKEKVAEESKMLVTIIRDVPFKFHLDETVFQKPDLDVLLEKFRKYEFRSLLRKYSNVSTGSEMPPPPIDDMRGGEKEVEKSRSREGVSKKIEIIRDVTSLEASLALLSNETVSIVIGSQTPDLFGTTLAAIALSDGVHTMCVVNPNKEMLGLVQKNIFAVQSLVVHDEKKLLHLFSTSLPRSVSVFDTLIASYLLHAGDRSDDLAEIFYRELRVKTELPISFATEKEYKHLCEFAVQLIPLQKKLRQELSKTNQEKVFDEIEMPLVPVLYKMEEAGI